MRLQKGLDRGGFADLPEAALLRRRRILGVLPGELAELLAGEGAPSGRTGIARVPPTLVLGEHESRSA